MAYVNDSALDAALDNISTANRLVLCSQEPTTFAEANVTYMLGYKDTPTIGSPGDYAGGRQVTISAITDAIGDSAGTATHYALVNTTGSSLLATQALSASFVIAGTETDIQIDSFVIQAPDVA